MTQNSKTNIINEKVSDPLKYLTEEEVQKIISPYMSDKLVNFLCDETKDIELATEIYKLVLMVSYPHMMLKLMVKENNRKKQRLNFERKSFGKLERHILLEKYGYMCKLCGFKNGTDQGDRPLHIDHIIPLKFGGSNNNSNLQILCSNCNLKKQAKIEYYLKTINIGETV